MFILDPKGVVTDHVRRVMARAGRANDVVLFGPGGNVTYNLLASASEPIVLAENVLEGMAATAGAQGGDAHYWRTQARDWLSNAIALARAVRPTDLTILFLLTLMQNESAMQRLVKEGEAVYDRQQAELHALRMRGQDPVGYQIDQTTIAYFQNFYGEGTSESDRNKVLSALKAHCQYFVIPGIRDLLNPPLKPTFPGFREVFNRGLVVIWQWPVGEWGPVGRVLNILGLADFQQAARARIMPGSGMNRERLVYLLGDEAQSYLNPATAEFLSQSPSRTCA
jgi:hypothetical protein